MFFYYATRKISPICKISTFFEDLGFLNPRSHLKLQVHYNKDNYVIVQSLLSNTCDLFSRIFEVFNEMDILIN